MLIVKEKIEKFKESHDLEVFNSVYYTGTGDDVGIGRGSKLIFNMTGKDPKKYLIVNYNDSVLIKGITLITLTAPIGSCVDIQILNESDKSMGFILKQVPVLGSNISYLKIEDPTLISRTNKIKMTVYNASGNNGEEEISSFKLVTIFEIYRSSQL